MNATLCDACQGAGVATITAYAANGSTANYLRRCPRCNGSGVDNTPEGTQ